MTSDSPDHFEPLSSILNSCNGVNRSNAPVNLFEASNGAQSIAPSSSKILRLNQLNLITPLLHYFSAKCLGA